VDERRDGRRGEGQLRPRASFEGEKHSRSLLRFIYVVLSLARSPWGRVEGGSEGRRWSEEGGGGKEGFGRRGRRWRWRGRSRMILEVAKRKGISSSEREGRYKIERDH